MPEKQSRKELSQERKAKAIQMFNEGKRQKDIAKELGVSESRVSIYISKGTSEGEIKREKEPSTEEKVIELYNPEEENIEGIARS